MCLLPGSFVENQATTLLPDFTAYEEDAMTKGSENQIKQ